MAFLPDWLKTKEAHEYAETTSSSTATILTTTGIQGNVSASIANTYGTGVVAGTACDCPVCTGTGYGFCPNTSTIRSVSGTTVIVPHGINSNNMQTLDVYLEISDEDARYVHRVNAAIDSALAAMVEKLRETKGAFQVDSEKLLDRGSIRLRISLTYVEK